MGPELLGAVCFFIFKRSENVTTLPELLNEHHDLQAHHNNADDGGKDVETDPPVVQTHGPTAVVGELKTEQSTARQGRG